MFNIPLKIKTIFSQKTGMFNFLINQNKISFSFSAFQTLNKKLIKGKIEEEIRNLYLGRGWFTFGLPRKGDVNEYICFAFAYFAGDTVCYSSPNIYS